MNTVLKRAALAIVASVSISSAAAAAGSAEDAIKYRNRVMDAMAAHYGTLMLLLFDKVEGSQFTQSHADALANASAELSVLFPEYSKDGDTEALPAIWENPDAFAQAVDKAQKTAVDLQAAIAADDRKATLSAAAAVGKSCKGCHETYRAEED
jgi:cytochrome c556